MCLLRTERILNAGGTESTIRFQAIIFRTVCQSKCESNNLFMFERNSLHGKLLRIVARFGHALALLSPAREYIRTSLTE